MTNAERQTRWRARQKAKLAELLASAGGTHPKTPDMDPAERQKLGARIRELEVELIQARKKIADLR